MASKTSLYDKYKKDISKSLMKEFNYKSVMEVPRLEKIVINSGLGDATSDSKIIEIGLKELHLITGQKPVATKSKKSIATFKLREGQAIGAKVTLRKENMWNFLTKLISVAIPRIRDFRGLSVKSFDGKGNYTFGIKEQIIFPEIVYDDVKKIRGFDITIVTSAKTDKEALFLLKELGMPFVKTKETK
ncbi:MAG: 50S ribosomal protein L5 [Malacoplasma sp.]|nr:50S ribosomal protein L5 [Malacoplasma sp.]MDE5952726.1 50S ribosomal protein L5 [Malacoplasma sp.]MDE6894067.1 50S ribosomal protein L5 [Malacoplasma sp.]MDE7075140.1 50S ribosomal protein L5 [Malacoplasma sp.]MDE7088469.1 50S ribosomal protein L5 [Malacoplasma sp.]